MSDSPHAPVRWRSKRRNSPSLPLWCSLRLDPYASRLAHGCAGRREAAERHPSDQLRRSAPFDLCEPHQWPIDHVTQSRQGKTRHARETPWRRKRLPGFPDRPTGRRNRSNRPLSARRAGMRRCRMTQQRVEASVARRVKSCRALPVAEAPDISPVMPAFAQSSL